MNMGNFITTLKNSTLFGILLSYYKSNWKNRRKCFGYIHPSAFIRFPIIIKGIENVYMYENSHFMSNTIIMTTHAKFIIKKNSGAAEGLTVITGNHHSLVGRFFMDISDNEKPIDLDKDVIIEEDVWIATNVTLLSGVICGRGSVIGSGAVCRKSIPPYAIVTGNPAKIVGFKFTPDEVIEHEKLLYPENERLPHELLENNYQKYFFQAN